MKRSSNNFIFILMVAAIGLINAASLAQDSKPARATNIEQLERKPKAGPVRVRSPVLTVQKVDSIRDIQRAGKINAETTDWVIKILEGKNKAYAGAEGGTAYVCSDKLNQCLCSSAYDCVLMISADNMCDTSPGSVSCNEEENWCTCNQS